jgi:Rrf2 family protein
MAMLDLALHYGEGPILVKDIARRQYISERYLEHLLISLKAAGMVRSARGTRGGFSLAKPPSQTKLSEIIAALEGSMAPSECVDVPEAYPRATLCAVYDVWVEVKAAISSILESTTLQDLVERQVRKEATAGYKVREAECH